MRPITGSVLLKNPPHFVDIQIEKIGYEIAEADISNSDPVTDSVAWFVGIIGQATNWRHHLPLYRQFYAALNSFHSLVVAIHSI